MPGIETIEKLILTELLVDRKGMESLLDFRDDISFGTQGWENNDA